MRHDRRIMRESGLTEPNMTHYDSPSQTPIDAFLKDLGKRFEAYRIARGIKQADLAERAGIGRRTLTRLENGQGATLDTVLRVLRALDIEARLFDVVPDANINPLDPMSAVGRRRRRVRSSRPEQTEPWKWGDEES